MTQVRLSITRTQPDGERVLATGRVLLSPHRRQTADGDVVTPELYSVRLDGITAPVVDLDPRWAWRAVESVPRGIARTVLVPDAPATIDYAALVDVDPATLEPSESAVPAWEAAVAAAETARLGAEGAAADAATSASEAAGHVTAATAAALTAGEARDESATARDEAVAAVDGAQAEVLAYARSLLTVTHQGGGIYLVATVGDEVAHVGDGRYVIGAS